MDASRFWERDRFWIAVILSYQVGVSVIIWPDFRSFEFWSFLFISGGSILILRGFVLKEDIILSTWRLKHPKDREMRYFACVVAFALLAYFTNLLR